MQCAVTDWLCYRSLELRYDMAAVGVHDRPPGALYIHIISVLEITLFILSAEALLDTPQNERDLQARRCRSRLPQPVSSSESRVSANSLLRRRGNCGAPQVEGPE